MPKKNYDIMIMVQAKGVQLDSSHFPGCDTGKDMIESQIQQFDDMEINLEELFDFDADLEITVVDVKDSK